MCNSQFCTDQVTRFVKRHRESTYESYEDQRCECGMIHFDSHGRPGLRCLEGFEQDDEREQTTLNKVIVE